MKILKIIIAALIITAVDAVVGAVTCGNLFNWVYKLEPANIWKSMDVPPGVCFFVASALLNVVFVLVYAILYKGIPGKSKWVKGLVYGVCVWAIGMLPGMLMTHTFMTVATEVIIYWTVLGLVQNPLRGLIASVIYGCSCKCCSCGDSCSCKDNNQ